jgi:UDP-3-O-[3-hydroxymyristoyl] glucosamine N-acyltransferase
MVGLGATGTVVGEAATGLGVLLGTWVAVDIAGKVAVGAVVFMAGGVTVAARAGTAALVAGGSIVTPNVPLQPLRNIKTRIEKRMRDFMALLKGFLL